VNRQTPAGDASVALVCATFRLSRAAFYAEARRQRGDADRGGGGQVIALPRRPRYTAAEVVLKRIQEVLARDTATAWGVTDQRRRDDARSRSCHRRDGVARALSASSA